MTAILGIEDQGKLYLIGDSYTGDSSQDYKALCLSPKVYKISEFIVGLCGSPRHELLLEEILVKETKKKSFTPSLEWLKYKLPKLLRNSCVEAGMYIVENGEKTMGTSGFIIGFQKTFYYLDSDFSLWATKTGIVGIGVASQYALGALSILEKDKTLTVEEKLTKALDATTEFSHFVCKPYTIVSI